MALAEDDDGFAGRFDPSDDLLHIVVPDDLRELDAEVAAYRRELELARRSERRSRRIRRFVPKWARAGLPSPVFTVVLLLIATTGLMLSVFAPVTRQSQRSPTQTALAHPSIEAPNVGALLPSVTLLSDYGPLDPHEVRPAVFVLLPAKCDCDIGSLVGQIISQASEPQPTVQVVLVSSGSDTSALTLVDSRGSGSGFTAGVRDTGGVLANVYHAGSARLPTLLLVHSDGTLAQSPKLFHNSDRIEIDLQQLRN